MSYSHGYVNPNGARLHYLIWDGDHDRSFLILHGNSHCGGLYTPLAERLASDGATVVALDMRGHGLSDKPEGGYDWVTLRQDAIGVIESLDLRNVVFVGHSRGGGVCLLTASLPEGRAAGLALFEPTLPRPAAGGQAYLTSDVLKTRIEQTLRRRTRFASKDDAFNHFRPRDVYKNWREDYLRAFVEHGTVASGDGGVELACPPRVQVLLYEATLGIDVWRTIGRDDLPVTAVYGDNSGRLASEPEKTLRAMYRRTRFVVMRDASHSGPMEHPEQFEALVREVAAQAHAAARPVGS